jgi:hypothetical protein
MDEYPTCSSHPHTPQEMFDILQPTVAGSERLNSGRKEPKHPVLPQILLKEDRPKQ